MEFTGKAHDLKRRSLCLGRRLIKRSRRLCALLLCASLVIGGFPSTFFQAFASDSSGEYCYELERESLFEALLTAVSEGTTVEKDLDLTGEYADQYSELLDADGTLYELKDLKTEKVKDRDKVLDLRVFARIKDDIPLDSEYEVSGSETLIFLLINRSKDEMSAVIRVDDRETETIKLVPASSVSKREGPGSIQAEGIVNGGSGSSSGSSPEAEPAPDMSAGSGTGSEKETGISEAEESTEEDKEEAAEEIHDEDSEGTQQEPSKEAENDNTSGPADESGSGNDSDGNDGSGSESGSDKNDGSSSDAASDKANDSTSGTDHGKDGSEGKDNSGDKENSENNDHSDSGTDSGSSEHDHDYGKDGENRTAAISTHPVGLLALSLTETVPEEEPWDITIASVSDAEAAADEADESDTSYEGELPDDTSSADTIDGELYDAVLLDGKKAAVAFVTTAQELGLDEFCSLEEQTIEAKIYADPDYDFRLADGTTITLTGMLPAGAVAKAYPVDVKIEDVRILAAYDITIFNKNGREFQPKDDVIEVLIENDAINEALENEHELTVYHMEDEADEAEEIAVIEPAPRKLKMLSFPAERFSIYVVGEDDSYTDMYGEEVDVYTVNFYEYVFDDETLQPAEPVSTQKVVGEDHLLEPYVPEIEHYVFDGWFTVRQDGNHWNDHTALPGFEYDFELTVSENLGNWAGYKPDEGNVINLYSDYDPIYYVYYMTQEKNDEAGNPVTPHNFYTEEYHEKNSALNTSYADSLYRRSHLSARELLTTWYYYDDEENIHYINERDQLNDKGEFEVKGDLTLYPVVEGVIWIYFDLGEKAGENVEAISPYYVSEEAEEIGKLPAPKIPGYEFAGWYVQKTTAGGGVEEIDVTEGSHPKELINSDEDYLTLHARWEPGKAGYIVNIWRQKVTDGNLGIEQKSVSPGEKYEDYITYYDYAENYVITEDESELLTGQALDASVLTSYSDFGGIKYGGYDQVQGMTEAEKKLKNAYNCFEYNEERTKNDLGSKTIAADGTTVINVFYDRITVTWTFQSGTKGNIEVYGTLIGLYGSNVTPANGSGTPGSMSAWPEYGSEYVWCYDNVESKSIAVGFETFYVLKNATTPEDVILYPTNGGKYSATNHFYLELTNEKAAEADEDRKAAAAAEGVPYIKEVKVDENKVKYYVYGTTHRHYWSGSNKREIYFDDKFAGYTVVGYGQSENEFNTAKTDGKADITDGTVTYIYNDAYEYEIDLWSNSKNGLVKVDGYSGKYKYGADLSEFVFPDYLDPTVYAPNYYYHLSDTWYEDPSLTAELTMPDSMPEGNLAIYAGWELNEVTVIFQSNVESDLYDILNALYPGGVDDRSNDYDGLFAYAVTITAGQRLNGTLDEGLTQTEGEGQRHYSFNCWLDPESDEVFNFDSHIYEDITLKAYWLEDEIMYYVCYNINNESYIGEGVAYGTAHDFSSHAKVKELTEAFENAIGLESAFICWITEPDGGGTSFYPDDEISFADVSVRPVYDESTDELLCYVFDLYAKWIGTKETSLVLDYNYPDGYLPGEDGNPVESTYVEEELLKNLSAVSIDDCSELSKTTISVGDDTYVFVGWGYSADVTAAAIAPGSNVAVDNLGLNMVDSEKNILYAVWIKTPVKEIAKVNGEEYTGGPVGTGDEITYEITYTNYTDKVAVVTITDELDEGLTYVSSDNGGSYDEGSHTVTWIIPDVIPLSENDPGEDHSGTVSLTVMVNENAGSVISNQAGVKVNSDEAIDTNPVDVPVGTRLPDTGGPGTLPYTFMGLLMMSGAALVYLALRRRKVRVGK